MIEIIWNADGSCSDMCDLYHRQYGRCDVLETECHMHWDDPIGIPDKEKCPTPGFYSLEK